MTKDGALTISFCPSQTFLSNNHNNIKFFFQNKHTMGESENWIFPVTVF